MRLIRYSALSVLLLLVIVLGIMVVAPSMLVRPVLAYYLGSAGVEMRDWSGLTIGTHSSSLDHVLLDQDRITVIATGAELAYSLTGLLQGNLRAVTIDHLDVYLKPTPLLAPEDTSMVTTLPAAQISDALQLIRNLPVDNLQIGAIDVRSGNSQLDVTLQVGTSPLRVSGTVSSSLLEGLLMTVDAAPVLDSGVIDSAISIARNAQQVLQIELELEPESGSLELQATGEIDRAFVQSYPGLSAWLPAFTPITDALTITAQLSASDLFGSPAISIFELAVDSSSQRLQVDLQSDSATNMLSLQLPLRVTGAWPALDDEWQLTADPLVATLSHTGTEAAMQAEFTFEDIAIACTPAWECAGDATLSARVHEFYSGELALENLPMTMALNFTTNDSGLALTIPRLLIGDSQSRLIDRGTATSLQFEATVSPLNLSCSAELNCTGTGELVFDANNIVSEAFTASNLSLDGAFELAYSESVVSFTMADLALSSPSLQLAATELDIGLRITDLEVQYDEQLAMSFALASQHLNFTLDEVKLANPAITGDMSYSNEILQSTLELGIAGQLHTNIALQYNTTAQSGTLEWDLSPYYFSQITPLSALVAQTIVRADLVAGSIAGTGSLDITSGTNDTWHINGPVLLQLNELSGFVADSFFVGLTSEIRANMPSVASIRSNGILSGSIATLDVGLPLTDIQWQYRFDSAMENIHVSNLAVKTLGGDITIADFDYDLADPDTQLTVVLTNLDLNTIVGLAQYPGLDVQGLISGYLPVRITNEGITVTEGLIGALQPGGTVRYASGSPASSGNAQLDLVNRALANYHYQILNSHVTYNAAGDLHLAVQLQGNNPDLYNGQVVNLNVNIDDNIPTLLRSLQASRTITDALEQRLQNR